VTCSFTVEADALPNEPGTNYRLVYALLKMVLKPNTWCVIQSYYYSVPGVSS